MLCPGAPVVALHGFLGSPADWNNFDVTPLRIPPSLEELDVPEGSILMGYSMGGRIAMQLANKYPERFRGLILIGAHPGLKKAEIAPRKRFEEHWLNIFATTPYANALQLWYDQPIFDSLRSSNCFEAMMKRRLDDPSPWQYMETYSLCKQSDHLPNIPTVFMYGENDTKYALLANRFTHRMRIAGTGHAPHIERPAAFEASLRKVAAMFITELL